jgi:Domain of unknown function DUF29
MEAAMPDGLYERDILDWAEQQASLLRRLARGERVNDAIDWPNLIEEVQDLGLSELAACKSLLRQAMLHLIKLHLEPDAPSVAHWRSEVVGFLGDAADRFTPSMRQRIDLAELWRRAQRQSGTESGRRAADLPPCPYTLDDLLDPDADPATLAARISTDPG